jgi:hypothetical protein
MCIAAKVVYVDSQRCRHRQAALRSPLQIHQVIDRLSCIHGA